MTQKEFFGTVDFSVSAGLVPWCDAGEYVHAITGKAHALTDNDIEKKAGTFGRLNLGQLAAAAPRTVTTNLVRYRHSKTVMRAVRRIFQDELGQNMRVVEVSTHIAVPELAAVVQRL